MVAHAVVLRVAEAVCGLWRGGGSRVSMDLWGVQCSPRKIGWGVREKGSIDRTIDQLLSTLASKFLLSIENGRFFCPRNTGKR